MRLWLLIDVLCVALFVASGLLLPLTESSFQLGNLRFWKIRTNWIRVQTVSDCTAWDFDKPFHLTCMALFKQANKPMFLHRWRSSVCGFVSNKGGTLPDTVSEVAAGLKFFCESAKSLWLRQFITIGLAAMALGLLLLGHLKFRGARVLRTLSLAPLAGAAAFLFLRFSTLDLSLASAVPAMYDGTTPMLSIKSHTRDFRLAGVLGWLAATAALTTSIAVSNFPPERRRNRRNVAEEDQNLLSFWAITPAAP